MGKTYCLKFSGECYVEAESLEDAAEKAWHKWLIDFGLPPFIHELKIYFNYHDFGPIPDKTVPLSFIKLGDRKEEDRTVKSRLMWR